MDWTLFFVITTFALYIGIAIWARAGSTDDFYVAGHDVHPTVNGMATAADWMSAASFLSMAGLIAFLGYGGSVYFMGWTGGYLLLAGLLAPHLKAQTGFGRGIFWHPARCTALLSRKRISGHYPLSAR